ncbi:hypothetical protein PsorP6_004927 [Peronosclerospora sorghi]|uniref:Uncharacterized protein n=1 Tax=Peronosclerospora sorghi TaxID=230839 RepID=A0ACC0W7Q3_9STRA|nr:hypothetical protein PsorP6_004927 [Peronosclerospora sorghi]
MRQAKLTLEEMEEEEQWVGEGSDVESLAEEDEPLESAGATALFTGLSEEALAEPLTSKYNTLVAKPCGCSQNCNESFGTDEFLPVARRLLYDVSLMSPRNLHLAKTPKSSTECHGWVPSVAPFFWNSGALTGRAVTLEVIQSAVCASISERRRPGFPRLMD